jgi:hypothetical protein
MQAQHEPAEDAEQQEDQEQCAKDDELAALGRVGRRLVSLQSEIAVERGRLIRHPGPG